MKKTGIILRALFAGALLSGLCARAGANEPKTIITGEEMNMTGGGNTVVFSGGAKVEKGASELTADKIVQDKKNDRVEAFGNVVFKTINQNGEPMRGSSQKAFYDIDGGRGELSGGKPEILYYMKTSTSPVVLDADDIKFDTDKEELYAKDNVVIITSSATAYAPNAVFIQKEKRIVLTGPSPQPLVIYFEGSRQNKYKADNITFLAGGDRIMLKGNVKAAMTVEDKNADRDTQILRLYKDGTAGTRLARRFGLSVSQIYRIINKVQPIGGRNKRK